MAITKKEVEQFRAEQQSASRVWHHGHDQRNKTIDDETIRIYGALPLGSKDEAMWNGVFIRADEFYTAVLLALGPIPHNSTLDQEIWRKKFDDLRVHMVPEESRVFLFHFTYAGYRDWQRANEGGKVREWYGHPR